MYLCREQRETWHHWLKLCQCPGSCYWRELFDPPSLKASCLCGLCQRSYVHDQVTEQVPFPKYPINVGSDVSSEVQFERIPGSPQTDRRDARGLPMWLYWRQTQFAYSKSLVNSHVPYEAERSSPVHRRYRFHSRRTERTLKAWSSRSQRPFNVMWPFINSL